MMGGIGAVSGIQAALQTFDRSTAAINQPEASSTDFVDGMVGMGLSEIDVRAGVSFIRAQDQMLGTLLDIKA